MAPHSSVPGVGEFLGVRAVWSSVRLKFEQSVGFEDAVEDGGEGIVDQAAIGKQGEAFADIEPSAVGRVGIVE